MLNQSPIRLLAALDENYLPRLQVLLTSVFINNPEEKMELYLIHRNIPEKSLEKLRIQCCSFHYPLHLIQVDASFFQNAPVSRRYPQEMYYRLRLGTDSDYFNSGVLLMDLKLGREKILPEDVFSYFSEHSASLLLPDQDILNAMYGNQIWEVDDAVWNYDARNYNSYLLRSSGKADLDWVIAHTAILHFCGRTKPWKPGYPYRFGILYKHYEHLTHSLEVSAIGKKSGNMSFIN